MASNLLKIGAPERSRTPNPQIRSLVLYPVELRALMPCRGRHAGGEGGNNYASPPPMARSSGHLPGGKVIRAPSRGQGNPGKPHRDGLTIAADPLRWDRIGGLAR